MRAEALMAKARRLSDIRAKNAPAFRLKARIGNMDRLHGRKHGQSSDVRKIAGINENPDAPTTTESATTPSPSTLINDRIAALLAVPSTEY
jgi:hypothetical protein